MVFVQFLMFLQQLRKSDTNQIEVNINVACSVNLDSLKPNENAH